MRERMATVVRLVRVETVRIMEGKRAKRLGEEAKRY